jgi:hypothetical protein
MYSVVTAIVSGSHTEEKYILFNIYSILFIFLE